MRENDKAKEQSESHGRDDKEIAGRCYIHMVLQESAPRLGRRFLEARHVPRNGGLCDVETELEQFAVDSGRAPEKIGEGHSADEGSGPGFHRWPTLPSFSALPCPEELESLPVPADDSIGLYDDERVSPAVPDAGEENP